MTCLYHKINYILGGMWGFYNDRDRISGKEIFKKMIDKTIASQYHKSGAETKRGPDQFFLSDHVYPIVKSRSIIHDSYYCMHYANSTSFPTERVGSCYVGIIEWDSSCAKNKTLLPELPTN